MSRKLSPIIQAVLTAMTSCETLETILAYVCYFENCLS